MEPYYKIGTPIITSADFDNAIFFRFSVAVWQDDFLVDSGGYIEFHDEVSVLINGKSFFKHNWLFKLTDPPYERRTEHDHSY